MEIVDLSHTLLTSMPVYPGTETVKVNTVNTVEKNGFNEKSISMTSHTGTHVDCPSHFYQHTLTTDVTPLEQFFGNGIVIDCRNINNSKIGWNVFAPYNKHLADKDFVLFLTGWDKHWGTKEYLHNFPTPTNEIITELIEAGIKGVGIDTISIDPVADKVFQNHKQLLSTNTVIVENLTNLNLLLKKSFEFACFPLKIKDGDGSPIRAVGITR